MSAGYRIGLVYHLVLRKSAAADRLRSAPDFSAHEARIAAHLRKWATSATDGNKLVWLLEHDYSQAGLSFDALKNGDAAVGSALARAALRADQSVHAAILHIEEHGIAVETGDYPDWDDLGKPWEMEEVFRTEVCSRTGSPRTVRGAITAGFRCWREKCCRPERWTTRNRTMKRPT